MDDCVVVWMEYMCWLGYCFVGVCLFFQCYGLDYSVFFWDGIDVDKLVEIGDGMVLVVVEEFKNGWW